MTTLFDQTHAFFGQPPFSLISHAPDTNQSAGNTSCLKSTHTHMSFSGGANESDCGTAFPVQTHQSSVLVKRPHMLAQEIALYLEDAQRKKLAGSTVASYAITFQWLLNVFGNIAVDSIRREQLQIFWAVLRWVPKQARPFLSPDNVQHMIADGRAQNTPAPAARTLFRHHNILSGFFTSMERARVIAFSPMEQFHAPNKISYSVATGKLFTDDELCRIFAHKYYTKWAKDSPHLWWTPLIALFTGARINEITQLKVADIVQQHGQWCFSIRPLDNPDVSNRLRRGRSFPKHACGRIIPIAPPLIDAGFLLFLSDLKITGCTHLFPSLSIHPHGTHRKTIVFDSNQKLCAQFGAYMERRGISQQKCFHSFRHTLMARMLGAGVAEKDICLITGRSPKLPFPQMCGLSNSTNVVVQQLKALAQFQPKIFLPVYIRGQFVQSLVQKPKKRP